MMSPNAHERQASVTTAGVSPTGLVGTISLTLRFVDDSDTRGPEASETEPSRRVGFWRRVLEERRGSGEITEGQIARFEGRIERFLGDAIRLRLPGNGPIIDEIIAQLQGTTYRSAQPVLIRRLHANEIAFYVRIRGYGSLGLDLIVGHLDHLASLFDHQFPLFQAFLETYVPIEFANILGDHGQLGVEASDNLASDLRVRVDALQDVLAAFQTVTPPAIGNSPLVVSPGHHEVPRESEATARARWLWIASNSSLLLPVVFALIVFFAGAHWLLDIANTRVAAVHEVAGEQRALIESQRAYIQTLHREPLKVPAEVSSSGSAH